MTPTKAAAAATGDAATKPAIGAEPNAARGLHDMTVGPIRGHVVRMMLFVLAGMTIQTLYSLVDIYWVGRLGKEAVAAVAMSSNLMFVSLALTQMLSVGCVALVAQATGRKDHAEVQRVFNQAQSLATGAGLVFLVACFALRDTYATRLASNAKTAELARSFLTTFIPALALQFTMIGLGSALRGIGEMKPGLVGQTSSVLLNMALAPVLIFGWIGPPLGVAGAGLSTLIATLAAVIGLAIYLVRGGTFLRLRFADWRPDLATWRRMLGIGLPSGGEFLILATSLGFIYAVSAPFGAQAQAGFGIGSRVMQAGFIPAIALGFSAATVAGQNFGARRVDRVRETFRESTKLTVVFMVLFTILCQLAPERMVSAFSKSPEVIAAGADYLRTTSLVYAANGVIFVSAGVFQGVGNTWPSLVVSAVRAIVLIVPILFLRRMPGFEMHTIWVVAIVTTTLQLVLQQAVLRRLLGKL